MMKKMIIGMVLSAFIVATFGVVHAARGFAVWQCEKCGAQCTIAETAVPNSFGCGEPFKYPSNKRHVWKRIK